MACLYLLRYSFEDALERIRERIKAHNSSSGVLDSPTGGYHETMTQAWLRMVHLTLCEYGPSATVDEFYEISPQLSQKKVLRLFYSKELFMSARAKSEFVEPDLAPLPKIAKRFVCKKARELG